MDKDQAIVAMGALAQITRFEAFQELVKREPEGLAAGELARRLGVPQNTLSAHLSILSRADLVTAERRSRSIIYRANLPVFQAITLFLLQDCCGGRAGICTGVVKGLATPRPSSKTKASIKLRTKAGMTA
jgi:ArsR family transcriptional regulator